MHRAICMVELFRGTRKRGGKPNRSVICFSTMEIRISLATRWPAAWRKLFAMKFWYVLTLYALFIHLRNFLRSLLAAFFPFFFLFLFVLKLLLQFFNQLRSGPVSFNNRCSNRYDSTEWIMEEYELKICW